MSKRKWSGKWSGLPLGERVRVLLSAIKGGGRTIKQLADFFGTEPALVEELLVVQREAGAVHCTNKVWYPADEPLKPALPRAPRLTAKQELFLKRQGNLF